MIVSEVEAVGGFIGSSFSEPVLNSSILLTCRLHDLHDPGWP